MRTVSTIVVLLIGLALVGAAFTVIGSSAKVVHSSVSQGCDNGTASVADEVSAAYPTNPTLNAHLPAVAIAGTTQSVIATVSPTPAPVNIAPNGSTVQINGSQCTTTAATNLNVQAPATTVPLPTP